MARPRLSVLSGLWSLSPGCRAVTTAATGKRLKTVEDLPGPSFTKTLHWLLFKGYADKSHLLQDVQKQLYGPLWRSRFGHYDLVNVASAELISQVIRQEGRYPVRAPLPHWKEYRDLRNQAYGLHVETGSNWHRLRSALNPKMLKLQEVRPYAAVIQEVVDDLLQRVEELRRRSPDCTVPDMAGELYKFGFEGISSILFETRLGCLQEEVPTETLKFISAVNDMLLLSNTVALFPRWTRRFLPHWDRFVKAWDDISTVARGLIERRISQLDSRSLSDGLYLTYLLCNNTLSREEVFTSVTELLLGGVDTTSNTLSWALYHLARDPRAQQRLWEEVRSVCAEERPSLQDLTQMPYLKAVIKETLRLYPVVPGNARYVTENDVVLGEYWFPKETLFHLCHYSVCHSPDEFPDPESFVPERWLRSLPGLRPHHPYSYIPFGVGVRACVGKRVAEMEMYFALARLMQRYQVLPEEGAPAIEPKTRTLMIPGSAVNLRFLPRA
ncbi:unnamed protein product [Knipowitschia caucasica]|uniref:Cytochrome P450 n=1 Tax=Knipowitschia caucasica TaxID=637954 RepID=A0AAV2L702_KNICA